MELEVRCCCHPDTLLGHLDVPPHLARRGVRISYPIERPIARNGAAAWALETISLEVANFQQGFGSPVVDPYLALKSADYPASLLALIPGFRPRLSRAQKLAMAAALHAACPHDDATPIRSDAARTMFLEALR